jgi:hypothetical protein
VNRRGSRPFSTLGVCSSLGGDLGAAAQALLRAGELSAAGRAPRAEPLDGYLDPTVQLVLADTSHDGVAAVTSAWRALEPMFDAYRVTGEDSRRATIEGSVVTETYETRADGHRWFRESKRAPFTQRWRKDGGVWRLQRMCVGTWALHHRFDDPPGVDRERDAEKAAGIRFAPRGPAC